MISVICHLIIVHCYLIISLIYFDTITMRKQKTKGEIHCYYFVCSCKEANPGSTALKNLGQ